MLLPQKLNVQTSIYYLVFKIENYEGEECMRPMKRQSSEGATRGVLSKSWS